VIIFSLQGEVPTAYTTACGSTLGKWVNRQRNLFRDGKLKIERQEVLESVGLRLEKNISLSEVKEKQAKAKERLRQKQLQRLQQLQAQQNAQQQASTQRTSSTTLAPVEEEKKFAEDRRIERMEKDKEQRKKRMEERLRSRTSSAKAPLRHVRVILRPYDVLPTAYGTNTTFRANIEPLKPIYHTSQAHKTAVVESVLKEWRKKGGRFMTTVTGHPGLWEEMDANSARERFVILLLLGGYAAQHYYYKQ